MQKLWVMLLLSLCWLGFAHAEQNSAEAMKKCNEEATTQGLVDEAERKAFITECLKRETEGGGGYKQNSDRSD